MPKHDIKAYINMLTLDGNITLVGPETPLLVSAFALPFGRRLSGELKWSTKLKKDVDILERPV